MPHPYLEIFMSLVQAQSMESSASNASPYSELFRRPHTNPNTIPLVIKTPTGKSHLISNRSFEALMAKEKLPFAECLSALIAVHCNVDKICFPSKLFIHRLNAVYNRCAEPTSTELRSCEGNDGRNSRVDHLRNRDLIKSYYWIT